MAGDDPRLAAPQPVDPALLRELRATLVEIKERIGPQGDAHAGINQLCRIAGRQFRAVFVAMHGADAYARRLDKPSSAMPIDFIYTRGRTTAEPPDGPTDVYTFHHWKGTAIYFCFPREFGGHEIPLKPYYYQNKLYVVESQSLPSDDEYVLLGRRFASAVQAWIRWIDRRLPAESSESPAPASEHRLSTRARLLKRKKGREADVVAADVGRKERMRLWLAHAMLLVRDHPDWSDAKIAKAVGTSKSTLSRNKNYRAAAKLARDKGGTPPKGLITASVDSQRGDVEAIAPIPCDADNHSDVGQPIPGSKYVREYCADCGEPIKVRPESVGKYPRCQGCQEL